MNKKFYLTVNSLGAILVSVFIVLVILEAEVYAYLDPGATSFLIQIVAAGIVAAAFFARRFLQRIYLFFFHRRGSDDERIKK